jgi:hypothetical protein
VGRGNLMEIEGKERAVEDREEVGHICEVDI